MWISRTHYELLFENLTKERTKSADLQSRIAAQQSTLDWLTTHVNRLEHERGLLTQQRLGLVFPVPEIVRTSSRSDSSPDPDVAPPTGIDADSVHGTPMDSLPMAQMLSASLEDVGDEQAARMGISHDPQGYVKHR